MLAPRVNICLISLHISKVDLQNDYTALQTHKKAKWLSEKALQVAVKRREAKGKGERKDIPI